MLLVSYNLLINCTSRDMFPVDKKVGDREKVERHYMCSQIYHHLHCTWWSWTLPLTIFSVATSSVIGFYVSIRHTELAWYLYGIYWMVGFGGLLQLLILGHDVMFAKINSEEVVRKLQSKARSAAQQGLAFGERKKILKRSEALTGLRFGIAGFTNYSWAVTFGTCDEILHQLIFFLGL